MTSLDRMKELIIILQEAAKAYYAEDREIMSNFEYDKLYDELVKLEEETGLTRVMRELVLTDNSGASEYVKGKAQEIEALAKELRK